MSMNLVRGIRRRALISPEHPCGKDKIMCLLTYSVVHSVQAAFQKHGERLMTNTQYRQLQNGHVGEDITQ